MIVITVAKKPSKKSITDTVLENGCGAINISTIRVGNQENAKGSSIYWMSKPLTTKDKREGASGDVIYKAEGRWPANLLLCDISKEPIDKQSLDGGMHSAGHAKAHDTTRSNGVATSFGGTQTENTNGGRYGDKGGASRFFKVFK